MAIYVDDRRTHATPDGSDYNFPSPGSGGDGKLYVFCQTSSIGGYDVPDTPGWPGWQVALAAGGIDYVFWGIQGVHIPDAGPLFTGASAGIATIITRLEIEGNIDETSYVEGVFESFVDAEPVSGYWSVDQYYVNRGVERIHVSFMGQNGNFVETPPWSNFDGSHGMPDILYVNQRVDGTAGDYAGVSMGMSYFEDNADAYSYVGFNRFYPAAVEVSRRANGCNFAVYGAQPKQTDITAPALVF